MKIKLNKQVNETTIDETVEEEKAKIVKKRLKKDGTPDKRFENPGRPKGDSQTVALNFKVDPEFKELFMERAKAFKSSRAYFEYLVYKDK